MTSKDQLWWLLVASADGPEVWTEERTNEGELEDIEPRQLDGVDDEDAAASGVS